MVVIAIYASLNERAVRMLERGDTQAAVRKRLQTDEKEFENLHLMADAWFRNDDLEKTVKAVRSYIAVMEGEA